MPKACLTCIHPQVDEINKALTQNTPYRHISRQFGVHHHAVQRHAVNHIQPLIDQANKAAEKKIVTRILKFREEVNYSALDKSKMMQHRILNDLDAATDIPERVSLYREFRGALQEEAKLSGRYQENRANEENLKAALDAIHRFFELHPDADRDWVINAFIEGRDIPRSEIVKQLGDIG